ncbi:MAG: BrnA antitoxin family protein [Geminicoccaceae bacterium]
MADDDTRTASLDEIRRMRAKGLTKATPPDAPEIELDEEFWRNARIVSTAAVRKTSVHLRIDPETFAFFRAGGKGHLTRMAKVLKAYAKGHHEAVEK